MAPHPPFPRSWRAAGWSLYHQYRLPPSVYTFTLEPHTSFWSHTLRSHLMAHGIHLDSTIASTLSTTLIQHLRTLICHLPPLIHHLHPAAYPPHASIHLSTTCSTYPRLAPLIRHLHPAAHPPLASSHLSATRVHLSAACVRDLHHLHSPPDRPQSPGPCPCAAWAPWMMAVTDIMGFSFLYMLDSTTPLQSGHVRSRRTHARPPARPPRAGAALHTSAALRHVTSRHVVTLRRRAARRGARNTNAGDSSARLATTN